MDQKLVHFFLLQNNISLCGYTTCFAIPLLMDISIISSIKCNQKPMFYKV